MVSCMKVDDRFQGEVSLVRLDSTTVRSPEFITVMVSKDGNA